MSELPPLSTREWLTLYRRRAAILELEEEDERISEQLELNTRLTEAEDAEADALERRRVEIEAEILRFREKIQPLALREAALDRHDAKRGIESRPMARTLTAIAMVIAASVATHEIYYRRDHPHAPGPSGVLIALGVAVAALAVALWLMTAPRRD